MLSDLMQVTSRYTHMNRLTPSLQENFVIFIISVDPCKGQAIKMELVWGCNIILKTWTLEWNEFKAPFKILICNEIS